MMISVFSNFLDPLIEVGLLRDVDQTRISALYEELRIAYNQGADGIRNTTRLFVPYYEQDPDKFDNDLYYKLRSNERLFDLVKWFNEKFIPEFPHMKQATVRVRVKIFRSKLEKLMDEGCVDNETAVKLYLNLVESLKNEERCMFQEQADDLPFLGSPFKVVFDDSYPLNLFDMKANTPRITEEEIALIKSAQAGNMQAFNKLYYRYQGFTTNILYRYIKDFDESREINNLVWCTVYEKLSKFVDYSSFGGWLRILTNHIAVDYLRKLKPSVCVPEPLDCSQVQESDGEETSADIASYNQILEVIRQFPEDVRRIFELHYVEHLTVAEISEITKIPDGTIKSHLSRKRKLIKKLLKL